MTPDVLSRALQVPLSRASQWADPLSAAMARYGVSSSARQAAFLAQVGHESGGLVYVRELWGPTAAQSAYEGRGDLGNTEPGDGRRFLGRGLIQITGRTNYAKVAAALDLPLLDHPELLEVPVNAAGSAGLFWQTHGLNELADAGDMTTITRRINGGLNGLDRRLALWTAAKAALGG
ncbi:glycoside hydrolase family 19 protein [Burkholderia stagnalis]|uniref:Glycoside hydrolase family 19 protein n=1 Tax=Burkholderia stagnalis TaxID=1503054 RepID=A0ABX9YCC5_9BURK|nr:glycoside hydrolase family 19 protein [Burkholderia stagnalis]RQQ46044.1 glycoside hydrolase family 19 protein [Burkholderia stagnalis]RQQ58983.1 glycoside hydrolase family 19 protein [Burkholderia stagnalis]RQQ59204.1 glycoside hydrolase family 19 protein [Burkholderia stagnalis]RQQ72923.1 glycoside hydrolase family 19 protein [Burkholderia stagnalis]RQQ77221.1 glycoside hydrolase family 19 protein [Burkholderia stagnalis]